MELFSYRQKMVDCALGSKSRKGGAETEEKSSAVYLSISRELELNRGHTLAGQAFSLSP